MSLAESQPSLLYDIKVHPAAAVFPMLDDDTLRDLAADIKANGLNHPITLDTHGVLIDGRNRYAACNLAGVEPDFETFEGDEDAVVRFILSENVHRRHISKGQLAMATVRATNFSSRKSQGKQRFAEAAGLKAATLSKAITVEEYATDLAELVLSGARFLDDAYAEARRRKLAAESDAESDARALRETNAKTARLREHAPDLADLVAEWRLSLDEAIDLLETREADARERRVRQTRYFVDHSLGLRSLLWRPAEEILAEWEEGATELQKSGPFAEQIWSPEGLHALAADLDILADALGRQGGAPDGR